MTLDDLQRELIRARIDPRYYVIDGYRDLDDVYFVVLERGTWLTFYGERGGRHSVVEHASEHEACEYFLRWIMRSNIAPK